jgi:rhodanese-related sulfurtransferase/uncharacterized membrane protein (DUF485 family)
MTPFPLTLTDYLGHWGAYIVYLLIGFAFGFVLEISGFGNSKKLAAQFYFKDLTVLKVMFTAIVTAMILIFLTTALGLLDYNLIWVNPTYLWPGIVGGLIMGVGFIVGGFCPGTSLVAAATLKLDGLFFTLGAFFGIFLFGETVGAFDGFFNSSYMGRYTLPEMLGLPTGVVVLLITIMALLIFYGGEIVEKIVGQKTAPSERPRWRFVAAGGLVALAAVVLVIGQPTTEDRWEWIADEQEALLAQREIQIHPGELLDKMYDKRLNLVMLDVRDEAEYNLFHLLDARHISLQNIKAQTDDLRNEPANTLTVVMSNGEKGATEAWKILVAESVPNVYILEGGINGWIDTFASAEFKAAQSSADASRDQLVYSFPSALGSRYSFARPPLHEFELEYTPKVKMKAKAGPTSGGCG